MEEDMKFKTCARKRKHWE